MSAGRQAFKLTEAARLIKATVMAGLTVRGVTTNREGKPLVITDQDVSASAASGGDASATRGKGEWDNI